MIAFLDYNGLQIDGDVESVMNINPIEDKFKTFGWNVITIDGHDFDQIFAALDMAKDAFYEYFNCPFLYSLGAVQRWRRESHCRVCE